MGPGRAAAPGFTPAPYLTILFQAIEQQILNSLQGNESSKARVGGGALGDQASITRWAQTNQCLKLANFPGYGLTCVVTPVVSTATLQTQTGPRSTWVWWSASSVVASIGTWAVTSPGRRSRRRGRSTLSSECGPWTWTSGLQVT